MANEPQTTELSPRAGIAMLTLQLRSTLQEADRLDRTDHPIDEAAARRQLRERLDPLIEERQRSYEEALAVARAESQQQIAAAHEEAQRRAAAAAEAAAWRPEPVVEVPVVEAPVVEAPVVEAPVVEAPVVEAPVVEVPVVEVPVVEAPIVEAPVVEAPVVEVPVVEAPVVEAPVVEVPVVEVPVVEVPVVEAPVEEEPIVIAPAPLPVVTQQLAPARPAPQEITVSIDADAFARVFATVFASLVDQRTHVAPPMGQAYAPGAYVQNPAMNFAPVPQPEARRQSFWSHARHPDVLLMSLATAIVLVVVVAWLV